MIFDFFNNDWLEKLISADLLSDDELEKIYQVVKYLFDAEDDFSAFCNTLTDSESYNLEIEGKLFPVEYPFRPKIWFDDQKHEKIIAYLLMSDIGFRISGDDHAFEEYNPYKNGKLNIDVVKL